MASKRINITDVFEVKSCGLCGSNELSRFLAINENFIEYCGVYYPFREILADCLHFNVSIFIYISYLINILIISGIINW